MKVMKNLIDTVNIKILYRSDQFRNSLFETHAELLRLWDIGVKHALNQNHEVYKY